MVYKQGVLNLTNMSKEINGRIYRQVSPAYKMCNNSAGVDMMAAGKYEFYYKDNWHPLVCRQMRYDLDKIFKQ